MVSSGEVASPFLSTAPAVPAPYVLASFGDAWNCRSPWVRHERTQACRASPCKKDMMRIVTDDAVACWRRVCKFVAGQYSLSAQRRANEPRSTPPSGLRSAAMPRPIRWLTKLRTARSSNPGIHYWRHAGEPSSSPTRFSINHQLISGDGGKTNSSSARARLEPLKPLHRKHRVIPSTCSNRRVPATNAHGLRVLGDPASPCALFLF